MKKQTTRTTDEEIKVSLKKKEPEKRTHTTDEEMTIEWMYKDDHLTHQPKDFEDIEY